MNKKYFGQFYTTNSEYICNGLLDIFPLNSTIVDMFAGNWDLLNLIKLKNKTVNVIGYDIDPKNECTILLDTLLNPVKMNNVYCFTNPPFLYRRNNPDKLIYDIYKVDDLYKASILSIIETNVLGGILIVPINFFCGLDYKIRNKFFMKYKVKKINIFHEQVFLDTTTTVCSFSFLKWNENESKEQLSIQVTIFPENKIKIFTLEKKYGYQIGGNVRNNLKKSVVKIKRLIEGDKPTVSKIFLRSVDSSNKLNKICLSINEQYFGKITDRVFATIIFDKIFTLEEQKKIVNSFNEFINYNRKIYDSLFLSNYRENNRKRIDFRFVFKIIGHCIVELKIDKRNLNDFFMID